MSPNYSRPAAGVMARGPHILSVLGVLSLLILIVSVPRLCPQVQAKALTSQGQHLIISATLSPATIGVAYEAVILVSGGTAPYRFKSKNLPSGLVLNQTTGEISGIPQAAGQF
jgi:hypothetical protein